MKAGEMKKAQNNIEEECYLPAQDHRQALRQAVRRGSQRHRFHPGWSPCPAWGHTRNQETCCILLHDASNSIWMQRQIEKKCPLMTLQTQTLTTCRWCVPGVLRGGSCRGWCNCLLRKTVHTRTGPRALCPIPQCAKSGENRQAKRTLKGWLRGGNKQVLHDLMHSHLLLAAAVIHHAVLGSHGRRAV